MKLNSKFGSWLTTELTQTKKNPIGNGFRNFIYCKCDCGTERYVDYRTLENGRSTSCGCRRKPTASLSGTVVGLLTVKSKADEYHWNCVCKCGSEIVVGHSTLSSYKVKSCGCVPDDKVRKLKFGEASMNLLIKSYMKRAIKKGFECTLNKQEFYKLFSSNCFYCKREPSGIMRSDHHYGEFKYNGIDRVNPFLGYTPANSRSCCKICNFAKHTMDEQEFYTWVKSIHNNLESMGLL